MSDEKDSKVSVECPKADTEDCNSSNPSKCEQCSVNSFQRLTESFETSARRWEMVVYPSLLAFVVLAAYGFYLVYNLTHDVHVVRANMQTITQNMDQVATSMDSVANNMNMMSTNVASMSTAMNSAVITIYDMNQNMKGMTVSVDQIRMQMGHMNYNVSKVSKPMNMLNTFMPW